jgi:hypothetical protein
MTDINTVMATQPDAKVSSKQFALNAVDFLRSLFMAVGGAVITVIEQTLEAGSLTFNWKQIGIVAGTAAVTYLAKNYFQKPVIQIPVTPTQVDAVKGMDTTAK